MAKAEPTKATAGPALRVRVGEWIRSAMMRRALALVVLTVGTSLLIVDFVRVPARDYQVGEVVDHDVRASTLFSLTDWEATQERQRAAEAGVQPVYDFDATMSSRLQERTSTAFDAARRRYGERLVAARAEGLDAVPEAEQWEIAEEFLKQLELALDPADVERIVALEWSDQIDSRANALLAQALRGYIIADRSLLPTPESALTVVRILGDRRDETRVEDYSELSTPAEARRMLTLDALGLTDDDANTQAARAAEAVARAAVRPNFFYNQRDTEQRRREARDSVPQVELEVLEGTMLVREGDVITRQQVEMIRALKAKRPGYGLVGVLLSLVVFCGVFYVGVYQFGAGYLRGFSTRDRDVEATAFLALLVLALGRMLVEVSGLLAGAIGMGVATTSFWYLVPVCGGAMLMRVLVNAETTLIYVIAVSAVAGILMEQQALFTVYFIVSGLVAAGSVAAVRERVKVLRAGVLTGLVNAAAALLLNLVHVHLGGASTVTAVATFPLWDVGFAFLGGVFGSIMVLGLVPMFEQFGFVTDFRLLELANLNHPLLRQLMLRAPGTYHHSVIVGTLSEAATESIGGNSLEARVACYFHDIGKAVKPNHFIENLRDRPNPHDRLMPRQSARIIINHVLDGEAIANQYNLPQTIIDGIRMHHGTGLIKYFYARALEQAGPDELVDQAHFRYPGPRPSTVEAGVIFLADRCEAACRTLKDPSEDNIRALIQTLINDAVMDGQLEECPLTLRDLYTIGDSFTETLLGIYHHRIEYPGIPSRRVPAGDDTRSLTITLEIDNPITGNRRAVDPSDSDTIRVEGSANGATPPPPDAASSVVEDPSLPPAARRLDDERDPR